MADTASSFLSLIAVIQVACCPQSKRPLSGCASNLHCRPEADVGLRALTAWLRKTSGRQIHQASQSQPSFEDSAPTCIVVRPTCALTVGFAVAGASARSTTRTVACCDY